MNLLEKSLVELRKTLVEMQITALDQQANAMALQATLLELVGQKTAETFAQHHAAEKHKLLAKRDSYQTDVDLLQTILDKYPIQSGPIH